MSNDTLRTWRQKWIILAIVFIMTIAIGISYYVEFWKTAFAPFGVSATMLCGFGVNGLSFAISNIKTQPKRCSLIPFFKTWILPALLVFITMQIMAFSFQDRVSELLISLLSLIYNHIINLSFSQFSNFFE